MKIYKFINKKDDGRVGDSFMNKIQSVAAYLPYMTCVGNHEWHKYVSFF